MNGDPVNAFDLAGLASKKDCERFLQELNRAERQLRQRILEYNLIYHNESYEKHKGHYKAFEQANNSFKKALDKYNKSRCGKCRASVQLPPKPVKPPAPAKAKGNVQGFWAFVGGVLIFIYTGGGNTRPALA